MGVYILGGIKYTSRDTASESMLKRVDTLTL
nr:MAG TPA: hypothetical protein [Caudoviricetes sp.]